MKYTVRIIAALLSAGWIVPAFFSLNSYLTFMDSELYPRLLGKTPLNSFPFLQFARQLLALSCAWLFVAAFFWAYVGTKHCLNSLPNKPLNAGREEELGA